jgi:hypothetical protein
LFSTGLNNEWDADLPDSPDHFYQEDQGNQRSISKGVQQPKTVPKQRSPLTEVADLRSLVAEANKNERQRNPQTN